MLFAAVVAAAIALSSFILTTAGGEVFFWRPSVSWTNPGQWKSGEVPCHADNIHLPATQQPWLLDVKQPLAVRKLAIGGNAGIRLGSPGSGLHFLRTAGGCQDSEGALRLGKKQEFIGAQLRNWGCASNWVHHDGSAPLRPPCYGDIAVFKQNDSIPWVHISDSVGVGQVIWRGRRLRNTDDWLSITRHQLVIDRHARFNAQCQRVDDCQCYTSSTGCEHYPDSGVVLDNPGALAQTTPATTTAAVSLTPTTTAATSTSAQPTTTATEPPATTVGAIEAQTDTAAIATANQTPANGEGNSVPGELAPTEQNVQKTYPVYPRALPSSSSHLAAVSSANASSSTTAAALVLTGAGTGDGGIGRVEEAAASGDQSSGLPGNTLLLIVCSVASSLLALVIALCVIAFYRRRHPAVKTRRQEWSPRRSANKTESHVYATPDATGTGAVGKVMSSSPSSPKATLADSAMLQASRQQIAEYCDPSMCSDVDDSVYSAAGSMHHQQAAAAAVRPEQHAHHQGIGGGGRSSATSSVRSSVRSSVPPPVPERRLSQQGTPTTAAADSFFYSPLPGRRFATPEMSVRRFSVPVDVELPHSEWKRLALSEFESCEGLELDAMTMLPPATAGTAAASCNDYNSNRTTPSQELYTSSRMHRSPSGCSSSGGGGGGGGGGAFGGTRQHARPRSVSSEKELCHMAAMSSTPGHHQQHQQNQHQQHPQRRPSVQHFPLAEGYASSPPACRRKSYAGPSIHGPTPVTVATAAAAAPSYCTQSFEVLDEACVDDDSRMTTSTGLYSTSTFSTPPPLSAALHDAIQEQRSVGYAYGRMAGGGAAACAAAEQRGMASGCGSEDSSLSGAVRYALAPLSARRRGIDGGSGNDDDEEEDDGGDDLPSPPSRDELHGPTNANMSRFY